jgi:hypothetical protein
VTRRAWMWLPAERSSEAGWVSDGESEAARLTMRVEPRTVGCAWSLSCGESVVARGVAMAGPAAAFDEADEAAGRFCPRCGRRRLLDDERSVLSIVARSNGPRAREAWDRWSARFCECAGPALASCGVVRSAAS